MTSGFLPWGLEAVVVQILGAYILDRYGFVLWLMLR